MKELQIELLDSDGFCGFIKAKKVSPPEGVSIDVMVGMNAAIDAPDGATLIILKVALGVATKELITFLAKYLKAIGTKRIRVDHEEITTVTPDKIERIVRTKFEIDQ